MKRIEAVVTIEDILSGVQRVAIPVNSTYESSVVHTLYTMYPNGLTGKEAPVHRHGAITFRFTIDDQAFLMNGTGVPDEWNNLVTTPQWE